jgi:galactofuranose transport system permease protein
MNGQRELTGGRKPFRFTVQNIPILTTLFVFLLTYTLASLIFPGFFNLYNFVNIFKANAYIGVIAVGMTLVILSGGIDLSVGSTVAFTTIFIAKLHSAYMVPCWFSALIALAIGTVLGLTIGYLISTFELPPFLVTLVAMFLMRGLAYMVHEGTISIKDDPLIDLMKSAGIRVGAGNLSLYVFIFFIVLFAGIYVSTRTKFGRSIYAIGGNENSAVLMGLPVRRIKISIYTINGFLASLGGVIFTIHLASGKPHAGLGLELDVIATVVIGGTLLTGGAGHVVGTFFGVLMYALVFKLPSYISAFREWYAQILVGVLVLTFILVHTYITSNSSRFMKKSS